MGQTVHKCHLRADQNNIVKILGVSEKKYSAVDYQYSQKYFYRPIAESFFEKQMSTFWWEGKDMIKIFLVNSTEYLFIQSLCVKILYHVYKDIEP